MKSDSTLRLVYYSTISDIFQPYLYFRIYILLFFAWGLEKPCEKCYNKLKNFNDKFKNRYKKENAKALDELDYMWNNLSEVAQER